MYLSMIIIGFVAGLLTGMVSVGGGIIIVFSLLFLLPLVSGTTLPMQTIAGLAIFQSVFSSLTGSIQYIRSKLINYRIALIVGIPGFFGGMCGVFFALNSSEFWLKLIFCILAVTAAIVMQLPYKEAEEHVKFTFTTLTFLLTVVASFGIGLFGGLLGIAAGFLFVPAMVVIFRLPIKRAIGTALLVCLFVSVGSFISKLSFDTIPFGLGSALIVSGIVGAFVGGQVGKRLNSHTLRKVTAYSILLVSIRLIIDLLP